MPANDPQLQFLIALEGLTEATLRSPRFKGQAQAVKALRRIAALSVFEGRGNAVAMGASVRRRHNL